MKSKNNITPTDFTLCVDLCVAVLVLICRSARLIFDLNDYYQVSGMLQAIDAIICECQNRDGNFITPQTNTQYKIFSDDSIYFN